MAVFLFKYVKNYAKIHLPQCSKGEKEMKILTDYNKQFIALVSGLFQSKD
jgi:hypothetical protein